MSNIEITVEIRLSAKPKSSVKAYADVSLRIAEGVIVLIGFAIVQTDSKPLFVGFPSKPGTIKGKFFHVVDLQGDVRGLVCKSILDAYKKNGKS